jgi:HlyD family secretion protein
LEDSSNRLFRQEALDRLSSPEQLDQMVTLAAPVTWAAALALGLLVLAAVLWGIFGRVPIWVEGDGILVKRGGHLFDAMAPTEGTVLSVLPVGTLVHKGDAVATLDDARKRQDLEHAQQLLREREQDRERLFASFASQISLKDRITSVQKNNQSKAADAADKRSEFYRAMLTREQAVIAQGVVSQRFVEETRQKVDEADEEARHARADILHLESERQDLHNLREQALAHSDEGVSEARRRVEELQITLTRETRITTPLDGQVTEIKATPGTVVAAGKPIASIETSGEGLEVLLYMPPESGKKVTSGMRVRVEPVTVKREQYGTLSGSVQNVTEFPVTSEGMLTELQNRELVTTFMSHGPPYETRVALIADAATRSGYAWSGGRGPPAPLTSGTIVHAEVTVSAQSPLSLLFPVLDRPAASAR